MTQVLMTQVLMTQVLMTQLLMTHHRIICGVKDHNYLKQAYSNSCQERQTDWQQPAQRAEVQLFLLLPLLWGG